VIILPIILSVNRGIPGPRDGHAGKSLIVSRKRHQVTHRNSGISAAAPIRPTAWLCSTCFHRLWDKTDH
jgi:hypothetical protein